MTNPEQCPVCESPDPTVLWYPCDAVTCNGKRVIVNAIATIFHAAPIKRFTRAGIKEILDRRRQHFPYADPEPTAIDAIREGREQLDKRRKVSEPRVCPGCGSDDPELYGGDCFLTGHHDAFHDTSDSKQRKAEVYGYTYSDTPTSEPSNVAVRKCPGCGAPMEALHELKCPKLSEAQEAFRLQVVKSRGDIIPATLTDPIKEVDDACMESFKNLPTGAASEDVGECCPTCKSQWMDERFDVGEGELKYVCPDWWHSEAYRAGIKRGRAESDTRVAEAERGPSESYLERLRRLIVEAYADHSTGCGSSFGELLCWEIHRNGQTFVWLAEKWGVSLPTLGELIWDHCKRLESEPRVMFSERKPL